MIVENNLVESVAGVGHDTEYRDVTPGFTSLVVQDTAEAASWPVAKRVDSGASTYNSTPAAVFDCVTMVIDSGPIETTVSGVPPDAGGPDGVAPGAKGDDVGLARSGGTSLGTESLPCPAWPEQPTSMTDAAASAAAAALVNEG